MIINCLSCGKSMSSHSTACPYCFCEVTSMTLEMNGIREQEGMKEKMMNLVFGFVNNK
ncbi:hypothetical protein M0P48_03555 [Candidatus Gracilibacteria bacterium]|nr:hypothetical protein [Candidatus Gracilibacteria bacterium]